MSQVSLAGIRSSTCLSLSPCKTVCSELEKHRKHLPEAQPLSPWPSFLTSKLYPPVSGHCSPLSPTAPEPLAVPTLC